MGHVTFIQYKQDLTQVWEVRCTECTHINSITITVERVKQSLVHMAMKILYFSFICTIIQFLEPASGVIPNGDSLPLLIIGVTVAILTLL